MNLRRLLFVPLLTLVVAACFASTAYARVDHQDGGVRASSVSAASPSFDAARADVPADVALAPDAVAGEARPAEAVRPVDQVPVPLAEDVADDRRDTAVFGSPCYDRNDQRGCPPYLGDTATLALTFSTITFTASGVTSVRPARLNC